jgi:hypothetical protein
MQKHPVRYARLPSQVLFSLGSGLLSVILALIAVIKFNLAALLAGTILGLSGSLGLVIGAVIWRALTSGFKREQHIIETTKSLKEITGFMESNQARISSPQTPELMKEEFLQTGVMLAKKERELLETRISLRTERVGNNKIQLQAIEPEQQLLPEPMQRALPPAENIE